MQYKISQVAPYLDDRDLENLKSVIKNKPKIFINISTDKVAESSTLYGATKQLGERLTNWAGPHIHTTKFATVRLGNIIESRGDNK